MQVSLYTPSQHHHSSSPVLFLILHVLHFSIEFSTAPAFISQLRHAARTVYSPYVF